MAEILHRYVEESSGRDPRRNWGGKSMGGGKREGRSCSKGKPGEIRKHLTMLGRIFFNTNGIQRWRGWELGVQGKGSKNFRHPRFSPCHHHRSALAQAAESSPQLLLSLVRLAIWLGGSWLYSHRPLVEGCIVIRVARPGIKF